MTENERKSMMILADTIQGEIKMIYDARFVIEGSDKE